MSCVTLADLPPPPPGKTGWPWTEASILAPERASDGRPWPKVSIVTPSFNHGDYIERAIRSTLLQGYPALEYIVVDGASTDGSVEIIRKYERWLGYWVSEPDCGPLFVANKGIARATGELLGFLCADDYYRPGGVRALVELRMVKPDAVVWIGACPAEEDGVEVDRGEPFIRSMDKIGDWGVEAWFNSGACLFDAQGFRAIGGLDERFKNGNDIDLWVRFATRGPFALTNQVVAVYRRDLQSVSNRDYAGETASWIATNHIHGHREVAGAILRRYGERQAELALRALPVGKFIRLKGRSALRRVTDRAPNSAKARSRQ